MYANSLRQEQYPSKNIPEHPVVLVYALGFGAALEEKLRQLFKQASHGQNAYTLAQPNQAGVHVLLVNYDNPLALIKKDILLNGLCAGAETIGVSQGPLDNAPAHHIRGMLTGSRLMAVLAKIPMPDPQKQPRHAPTSKIELMPATPLHVASVARRYRALVVDDSLAIQKSLELKLSALEQIGGIDFAASGTDALALARVNDYDLIFLDVMMEGLDGYETCVQLRADPRYKKTPIIMVSGKTSPLDEVKGVMAGCNTYLTKPIKDDAFQKLSLRILAWLDARKQDVSDTVAHASSLVRH